MERHFAKQENVSASLIKDDFSDLMALNLFLDDQKVQYVIEADTIGKEPPNDPEVILDL